MSDNNPTFQDLYKALKADGAVQGDWNSFRKYVGAPGKQGYLNRKKLYDALKADGAVSSPTYEDFHRKLYSAGKAQLQRNNAAQQPSQTTAQKAMALQQQSKQQKQVVNPNNVDYLSRPKATPYVTPKKKEPKGKVSAFVQGLYDQEDMQREQETHQPITYTSKGAFKQMAGNRKNAQQQAMNAAVTQATGEEAARRNQPIVKTETPADDYVVKTEGQLEDEVAKSAEGFVNNNMANYISDAVKKEQDASLERAVAAADRVPAAAGLAGGMSLMSKGRSFNEQLDTDAMAKRLVKSVSDNVQTLFSNPEYAKKIEDEAARLGISTDAYIQSIVPSLQEKLASQLTQSEYMKSLPTNTAEYFLETALDANSLGKHIRMAVQTKGQRIAHEQAMAQTREGKNPNYKPGIVTDVAANVLGMSTDPIFRGAAGMGGKASKAAFGNVASKIANSGNIFQKAGYIAGSGVVSGGVTGMFFGAHNAVLENYSTGDDTSLGNTLRLATTGALSEGASWSLMGLMGAPLNVAGRKIGLTGAERTASQYLKAGTAKVSLAAGSTIMEALGMNVGGYAAARIEGQKDADGNPVKLELVNGTLETLPTVIGFRLAHAKDLFSSRKGKDGKKLPWYQSAGLNLHDALLSDETKSASLKFTDDEKQQLFGSGAKLGLTAKGKDIFKFGKETKKFNPEDVEMAEDGSDLLNYYQQMMLDPNVSWDAKNKFSAAVMGVFSNSRPMRDYVTFTVERVGEGEQDLKKYVNEYAKDGTLISKTSYDSNEARGVILYRQNAMYEHNRLYNAWGVAIGKDSEDREMQRQFLLEKGYDVNNNPENTSRNMELIAGMNDKESDLYKEFMGYVRENGTVGKVTKTLAEQFGTKEDTIEKAIFKDPMKRTELENNIAIAYRRALEAEAFPSNKPHEEQSHLQGKDVAEDNNLGTEQPNSQAVIDELNNLKEAEDNLTKAMESNDTFKQIFEDGKKQGMRNADIYAALLQNGVTADEAAPLAEYMNANARVQGMQQATQQKIEQNVSAFVDDWAFKGTYNGEKIDGKNVIRVQDEYGRVLIVANGDMAFDETNGKAKEGVGDLLICYDENNKQTVYAKVEDVTLFSNEDAEAYKAKEIERLQNINSVPYNEAARAQAEADAAKAQQEGGGEGKPDSSEQKSVKTISDEQEFANETNSPDKISEEKDEWGKPLVKASDGSTNYGEISDGYGLKAAPIRLSLGENKKNPVTGKDEGYGLLHIIARHGDQIRKAGYKSVEEFVEAVSKGYTEIREGVQVGTTQTYLIVKKDGHANTLYIELSRDGKYWNVNSAGIFKEKYVDRKKEIKPEPTVGSSTSTDTTGVNHGQSEGAAVTSGNSPMTSAGKGTNNSSNDNTSETTLTFKNGEKVPMKQDSKGRPAPDYDKMTPAQSAEVLHSQFKDSAEKVADARIKKAKEAVKKAEKIKVDYDAEDDADILEQEAAKAEAIKAAQENLEKAEAIKKALTALQVDGDNVGVGTVYNTNKYDVERKQGYRIGEGNVRYDRQKPEDVGGTRGKEISVAFSPTVEVKGHAKLVELNTVQASHSSGKLNPYHFGHDWQPKNRNSQASKIGADKMAETMNPEKITGNSNAFIESAPSVNERHECIQGNNRIEALKIMYSSYPEQAAKYKQYLIDHAAKFDFDPQEIAKMKKPVIVSELPVDDATAKQLGQMTVDGFETGGSGLPDVNATINKLVQSGKVQNFINKLFDYSGDEDLSFSELVSRNADKALRILSENGIINNTGLENLMKDPTERRTWIEKVLKTSLFDGEKDTEMAFDSLPSKAQKAILSTFMRDAKSPETARVKQNLKNSFMAYNELNSSNESFKNAKNINEARAVINGELTNGNQSMFEEEPVRERYSTFELELAVLYKGLKDQKTLTGLFNDYFDAVQGDKVSGREFKLEETPREPISKEEALKEVFESYDTKPAESQQQVDEAVKSIATEITKGTGVEVVTDDKVGQSALEDAEATDSNIKFHKETDQEVLDALNNGETIKVYRAMQVIDGKLYPPMAASVGGKLVEANELGVWIRADENPDLAIPDINPKTGMQKVDKKTGELKWKFKLDKGGKDATGKKATDVNAAYNPYWHMSRSPLNDQFKSAWIRPNIVVVECEVPVSELSSGYKAERAKDAVGEVDWKSGSVSGEVFKQTGRARKVILSRWCKPVRVLDDAEVAQRAKEFVGEAKVEIPENVLTPKQRIAFEKAGFKIGAPEKGVKKSEQILEALERGLQIDNSVREQRGSRWAGGEVLGMDKLPKKNRMNPNELASEISQYHSDYITRMLEDVPEDGTGTFFSAHNGTWYLYTVSKGDRSINLLKAFTASRENFDYFKEAIKDYGFNTETENIYSNLQETGRTNQSDSDLLDAFLRGGAGRDNRVHSGETKGEANNGNLGVDGRVGEDSSSPRYFRSANGEVYGFTVDGKIYLDTKKMKPETPLHEYTHLWTEALKRGNPKEWENVKKIFDEVEGLKEEVQKLYPELKGEDLYEEMITTYSGREGAKKLEAVARELAVKDGKTVTESTKAQGFLDKVKTALQKYWKGVADMLHIHFTTAEEVADKVLADWAKGVNPKDVRREEIPGGNEMVEKVSSLARDWKSALESGDKAKAEAIEKKIEKAIPTLTDDALFYIADNIPYSIKDFKKNKDKVGIEIIEKTVSMAKAELEKRKAENGDLFPLQDRAHSLLNEIRAGKIKKDRAWGILLESERIIDDINGTPYYQNNRQVTKEHPVDVILDEARTLLDKAARGYQYTEEDKFERKLNDSFSDPMEALTNAAEAHREEKLDAARKAFAEAKQSGDESETKRTRDELKRQLDEKYKAQHMGLAQRHKEIAKEIGKEEAEKIDKPWTEMDGEERMFTAEKNPLTEDEIRNNTSEENKNFIEDAVDYINGKHGFAQKIAYLKIYEDVRNRQENAADNSGAKDGTQLAASDNEGGEGMELGTGRDSRGTAGQLDNGTGGESAPGERGSGESGKDDPTLSAGEQGDKQGEGNTPGLGTVSAGNTDTKGSGAAGTNGTKPKRGGRASGAGPAKPDAKRKPAAKQGTTWKGRSGEEIKKNVADKKAAALAAIAELKKRRGGTLGMNAILTPEQMEYVPTVMNAIKDYGMAVIDQGIYKIKDWFNHIRETFGESLKDCGFSDNDIDEFIVEMWNSKMEMDGETHTIGEWCGIYGNAQLRDKLRTPLKEKRQKQMDAESIEVKVGDRQNIEETLPYLLPQQQDDVLKAETQFFGKEHADRDHAYGKGYMFTNGTGTGKTYTGLGIAKRLAKQGKGRILFITPSQPKVKDWIKDGRNLGLDIRDLESIAKEKGTTATTESGEGMVITTYANMRQNKKLLETEWDAVIYDESHRIMENKKGAETTGSLQHYMLTNRNENYAFLRLRTINEHYQKMQAAADKFNTQRQKEIERIENEYKQTHPGASDRDLAFGIRGKLPRSLQEFAPSDGSTFPELGKLHQEYLQAFKHYNEVEPKLKEQAKNTWKNTKTIFLSATPFNTRENLDYAEGYIFKYPKDNPNERISPRSRFYMDHFGAAYRFRYNRLEEKKDNPDAIAKQEIAFSDYLQNELGTMSGRIIDSAYDYSRDFPTVAPDHAAEFNNATQEAMRGRYLGDAYHKTIGNYNYGSALFETMKVANIIQRMKDHIAAGRKIVVFHRRVETKEPLQPPFAYMLSYANEMIKNMNPGKERDEAIAEVSEFRRKYAGLLEWEKTLDYSMPREQIAKAFGEDNVLFFSGKESSKVKSKAVDTFNDDNSGKNIIVIQEASGKEGISLHDTTGNHQRVCITLALPQSPITALQIEGRIYRIGNMSNAIFEYPILGLNSEMMLFGEKFNAQVSTTENLALGSQARSLRESFANGVLEHSGIVPIDQQGVGGKEFDAPKDRGNSDPFDDAVLDYYSNQKLNRNNREGIDYFPTPEPLGYKMVEWANMLDGDTALEPSAGHGAIARYVPRSNQLLSIEPSQSLFTKLQLKAGGLGRKFLNNTFENYDVSNKHDVVVMNPPFGTAGATAIAHLDKAFKHLDEGGRVVALIPRGSTDKKFDKWLGEQKNVAMRAEVALPDIVFQQAGTRVVCRVVVLDKITDAAMRAKAGYPEKIDLSGHYDKIEDFFEDLRDVSVPDRIVDNVFKLQKKAKSVKKDIEEIKGVRKVEIDRHGISVKMSAGWKTYTIDFVGADEPNYWREKMANKYKMFGELERETFNEDNKAALSELQKLSCKLAGMSEEEMQRFINKGNDGENSTHFRTQYSKTDTKDVKNSRIIPEDVDKTVSSQIEKKFDEVVERVYGRELTPEEQNEVERIANRYRNTPLNDEYTRDKNGNRKNRGGLETAIKTWEEQATAFENYYGITRGTKLANPETRESGRLDGVSGVSSKSRGERRAVERDRMGYGNIPAEAIKDYQGFITNLAAAKRALEYHQERTRVLTEQYGVKHDEWLKPETIDKIFNDYNTDKSVQEIYNRIKEQVNDLGIYYGETYGGEKNVDGFYRHSLNDIRINLDRLVAFGRTKQDIASTILHEMLHPLTSDIIAMYQKGHTDKLTSAQREAAKETVDIFNELKQMQADGKIDNHYALTNAREMITELSSPEWRNVLAKIPEGKNLWQRFVNAVCKMLGFDPKYNKLGTLTNTLDKLLTNFGKEQFDFATRHTNELFDKQASKKVFIEELDDEENRKLFDSPIVSISDDAPAVVKHIDSVSRKTGAKVNIITSAEEVTNKQAKAAIDAGKKVTGWYDEKTGQVHLYMPNIHDSYTAEKTIWHETVGHKGMRELFGDKFDKFLDSVWYDLDKPENTKLKELVMDELKKNPFDYRNAIEEGVARLAEEGKGEPGFWRNIKNKMVDLMHEIGYRIAPNTKDVKYLLWLSKNLQKHPNDVSWRLKVDAVKYKLDKENTPEVITRDGIFRDNDGKTHSSDLADMPKKEYQEATDGQVHFRTAPSLGTAIDRYHRALNAHGYMATESFMDNMLSLDKLMRAIDPSIKKIEDVESSRNPYILQNTMQGAMSNAAEQFEMHVMKPLDKAMADLLGAFDGRKTDDMIRNFNLYMITKHGLERNRVFFVRDYIKGLEEADAKALQRQWNAEKKDLGDKLNNGSIDLKSYYDEMDEWIRNNVDKDYDASENDYSGLHGVQGIKDSKQPYDDAAAIDSVMSAEAKMEGIKTGSVKDFWSKVRTATDFALGSDYKNGIVSKDNHDNVSAMFDWYIPLRKFDKDTAEDVYGYITEKGDPRTYIGSTLMNAKGRKSLSETNVLAQIGAMGNAAINRGGQNAIKQAFMRFIRANSGNGLVTESKVWAVQDGTDASGNPIWREAYPDIPEDAAPDEIAKIVSDFETDMKAKQAIGDAKVIRNHRDVKFKFERAKDANQHVVDVMVNGSTVRFYVNGNPRAAQALNGMLENQGTIWLKPVASITRTMAQLCTSYSPEFVVRNIVRDAEFAFSNIAAKENSSYRRTWEKYYVGLIGKGIGSISFGDLKGSEGLGLYAKYNNGTLDMSNKVHRYFKEFMENGGETGWVQVLSMKDWEKKYKTDVKTERSKINKGGEMLKDFFLGNLKNINEAAENMARFATYCASRDAGRSAVRSAYDAKEVSTNFNRHGSGDRIWSFKNGQMGSGKAARQKTYGFLASYLRQCSMFFNAGIQSTNLLMKNSKHAAKGTATVMTGIPFAMGIAAALINNWLIASEDEKERKGVKDPYGELPEYVRRNNLCIYKGNGEFVTIPLAIELRAFYGVGDLAAGLTFSKNIKTTRPAWADAVGCLSQLVPIMDYTNSHTVDNSPFNETLKAFSPSAFAPLVEWGLNSDWKGAPIRREKTSYNEYAPAWTRAYKNTPKVFMDMNKKANAMTNDLDKGNENLLGWNALDAGTDPSAWNHFLGGFGGGMATFATRVTKLATSLTDGQKPETSDIPFVRSFLYEPNEQSSIARTKSKWYNYIEDMKKDMSNIQTLKKRTVPVDQLVHNYAAYYKIKNSPKAQMAQVIEQAESQMKQLKQMRDKSSDPAAIDNANKMIDNIMMRAVEQLDQLSSVE